MSVYYEDMSTPKLIRKLHRAIKGSYRENNWLGKHSQYASGYRVAQKNREAHNSNAKNIKEELHRRGQVA